MNRCNPAPAIAPEGFKASDATRKVRRTARPGAEDYGPRQAAGDPKKRRAKGLAERIGNSRRYTLTRVGIRAMTALPVPRDTVLQP
jgi:hypothetical protein